MITYSTNSSELKKRYIGDKEVKRVYVGSDLVYADNDYYGVKINHSTGAVERIGNMNWHKTLPIQNKMRRVAVYTNGTVADVNSSNFNDPDADIMVEIPEHYSQTYTSVEDGIQYDYIKLYPYARKGQKVPKHYHGAFKASIDRTTNQLRSICTIDVNNCDITQGDSLVYIQNADRYRGGNNNSSLDDTVKSQLGMPVTNITITSFANNAISRGDGYAMLHLAARSALARLFVVEYATLNSLDDYNSALTAEGYHQGGLGSGVTTLNGNSWNSFNNYYPLVPCGVTYNLGNNSGVVTYTLRAAVGGTTSVNVPSYRGVESPFGDIWEICNGIYIYGDNNNYIFTASDGWNVRQFLYGNSITPIEGFKLKANTLAKREGLITDWVWDEDGDFVPKDNTSGASTTSDELSPLRDYCWGTNSGAKRLLVGGGSINGVRAGLFCFSAASAVGGASASYGSRLLKI